MTPAALGEEGQPNMAFRHLMAVKSLGTDGTFFFSEQLMAMSIVSIGFSTIVGDEDFLGGNLSGIEPF